MPGIAPSVWIVATDGRPQPSTWAEAGCRSTEPTSHDGKIVILPAGVEAASASTFVSAATSGRIDLWPLDDVADWRDDWSVLPASLAARMRQPLDAVLVVPTPTIFEAADSSGDDSLGCLAIELADAGCLFHIALTPSLLSCRREWSLPKLVPQADVNIRDPWYDRILKCPALETASSVGAASLTAGLLQIHGDLDGSHQQAQSIEGEGRHRNGDDWHGIMHRRESDFGNSKYWFRRVDEHPVFTRLGERAKQILGDCPDEQADSWQQRLMKNGRWDPLAFVDLCEAGSGNESMSLALAARQIQWAEMRLLMHQTWADAAD